ncbi:hypothetical protein DFJ73DRAFT_842878 [Zopfochytrium polystomum]|nr:hypothetical protein DFJ73DRAFT_842878 [Zopfochytrium polystomum]
MFDSLGLGMGDASVFSGDRSGTTPAQQTHHRNQHQQQQLLLQDHRHQMHAPHHSNPLLSMPMLPPAVAGPVSNPSMLFPSSSPVSSGYLASFGLYQQSEQRSHTTTHQELHQLPQFAVVPPDYPHMSSSLPANSIHASATPFAPQMDQQRSLLHHFNFTAPDPHFHQSPQLQQPNQAHPPHLDEQPQPQQQQPPQPVAQMGTSSTMPAAQPAATPSTSGPGGSLFTFHIKRQPNPRSSASNSSTSSALSSQAPRSKPAAVQLSPYSLGNPNNSSFSITRHSLVERRATHNATERARRENLNTRFQELANSLPSMAQSHKPSKSLIVAKSIDFVSEAHFRVGVQDRALHSLKGKNDALFSELNRLRAMLGMPAESATKLVLTDDLMRKLDESAPKAPPSVGSTSLTKSAVGAADDFDLEDDEFEDGMDYDGVLGANGLPTSPVSANPVGAELKTTFESADATSLAASLPTHLSGVNICGSPLSFLANQSGSFAQPFAPSDYGNTLLSQPPFTADGTPSFQSQPSYVDPGNNGMGGFLSQQLPLPPKQNQPSTHSSALTAQLTSMHLNHLQQQQLLQQRQLVSATNAGPSAAASVGSTADTGGANSKKLGSGSSGRKRAGKRSSAGPSSSTAAATTTTPPAPPPHLKVEAQDDFAAAAAAMVANLSAAQQQLGGGSMTAATTSSTGMRNGMWHVTSGSL